MRLPILNLALTLACVSTLAALPVQAQSASQSPDDSPLWEVHLDLQETFASPLGQWVLAKFAEEEPDKLEHITKFAEAVGIDPRTDIGEVVVFGDGFDETDATVVANVGQSSGNLEGWLLAAPGYRSEDLDADTLLHSMTPEDQNDRVWIALPKHSPSGNYVLVGSFDRDRTVGLAQKVLAGSLSPTPNSIEGNTLLSFLISDLSAVPIDIDEDDPGSALVRIIERFGLNISSNDDNLNIVLNVSTSSAAKARQISQLLTGLKALMQLASLDEPKVQKIGEVLDTLVISHAEGESNVRASLTASYRLLEKFVNEID